MSHDDSVLKLGGGYEKIGISRNGAVVATRSRNRQFWGVQFHPEVSHCEYGLKLLENFVCGIYRPAGSGVSRILRNGSA